jgi:hypothetical protein
VRRIAEARRTGVYIRWPIVFVALLAALSGAHIALKTWAPEYLREWGRLGFGAMAAAILFFLSLYKIRKMILSVKLGSMEGWRQSHLYLGMICAALIMMHTNFNVHGDFGVLLIILFLFIIFSGVVGEILYRTVPVWLSKQGTDAQELDSKRKKPAEYLAQADDASAKASLEFRAFYGARIRPLFAAAPPSAAYLLMTAGEVAQRRKGMFHTLSSEGPATGKLALKSLEDIYAERDVIEFRWSRLMALRWWSMVHVPATSALLTAVILHLLAVAYF